MSAFHFLLDENVDPRLRAALHRQIPELIIWIVGDPAAPERGTLDPEILHWCAVNGFSLITKNRASMPVHLGDHLDAGEHVPGIFILQPGMSIGDTVKELALICGASEPVEYRNLLIYLPIT